MTFSPAVDPAPLSFAPSVTDERSSRLAVRLVVATAFVGAWAAAGFALRLRPVTYLLLGIPITFAFQRLVARRPLVALWVRGESKFDVRWRDGAYGVALAAVPLWTFVRELRGHEWLQAAWALTAVVGAVPAAFAIGRMRRSDGWALLRCLVIAGTVGVLLVAAPVLVARIAGAMPASVARMPERLGVGLRDFLCFVPITFLLEEVSFRGLLDAYVHPSPERRGIASAAFVSALWGLWHLPVVGHRASPVIALSLVVVHVAIGVPLTVFWRRSGNLAVPGIVHAFIDGVRDAVLVA
jgi:membrane protease YdiL (CAAX protease family)